MGDGAKERATAFACQAAHRVPVAAENYDIAHRHSEVGKAALDTASPAGDRYNDDVTRSVAFYILHTRSEQQALGHDYDFS
jgi:hypothetical protein